MLANRLAGKLRGWKLRFHDCPECRSKRAVLVEFDGRLQHVPRHIPKGRMIGSVLQLPEGGKNANV